MPNFVSVLSAYKCSDPYFNTLRAMEDIVLLVTKLVKKIQNFYETRRLIIISEEADSSY
jgi:hypothetical protein